MLALLLIGPATVGIAAKDDFEPIQLGELRPDARVVLMHPDISMLVIPANGPPKPRADWSELAQRSFLAAFREYLASHALDVTVIDPSTPADPDVDRYVRLYTAVANTIFAYHVGDFHLPSKGTTFDWSLGPDVASIGQRYAADYGLFVTYRGLRASSGKWRDVMMNGAVQRVPTGSDLSFAALVDMRSGDIVWFNPVNGTGASAGDLRDPERARVTVEDLLDPWPGKPARE